MTQPTPLDPPAPSWTIPIVFGVIATVLLNLPFLLTEESWFILSCCGCASGFLAGVFPAIVALRQDRFMRVGSGFAVAFIGVGVGAILLAIVAMAQGWQLTDESLERMREALLTFDPEATEEEVTESIRTLAESSPYLPVMGALMITVWGGVAGAITVAIGRRRQPRNPYPQPPDQYPPNPYDPRSR